jgi:cell wall-associated NlpC family hydrolase
MGSGGSRRWSVKALGATAALLLAAGTTAYGLWPSGGAAGRVPAPAAAATISPPSGQNRVAPPVAPAPTGRELVLRRAWIAVPVATIWDHPRTARPEDAAAVAARPDVDAWLGALDYHQKVGLDDLLATQALLDEPVLVFERDGIWDHVVLPGQTGAVFPLGVAGWVPDVQLSYRPPPAAAMHVTVAVPVLRLGGLGLSYGTTLPATAGPGRAVTVELPAGRFPVPSSAVRIGARPASGEAVVREAERFVGLPYLWAGTSAFGFDCSGLTYAVYRQFGVVLARDAADQARGGTPVAAKDLRPGDLVFFAFGPGPIDHVGIYAGNGMMVDSPHTGAAVEVVPLWSPTLAPYYAGARRYL